MFNPPTGMSLREFFEKINQGLISDNLIEAGASGFFDASEDGEICRYKDEKTGTSYEFYIY